MLLRRGGEPAKHMSKRIAFSSFVVVLLGIVTLVFLLSSPMESNTSSAGGKRNSLNDSVSDRILGDASRESSKLDALHMGQPVVLAGDSRGVHTVEGLVIGEDNEVAPGAIVYVGTNPPRVMETNESGFFSFRHLPSSRAKISARFQDWVAAPLDIDVANNPTDIVLRLRRTPQLRVRVSNEAGEPVKSARVELRGISHVVRATDERGMATLPTEGPSVYVVSVFAKGYGQTLRRFEFPRNARRFELSVSLTRGVEIHGIVVDENGEAVPGAKVWYAPTQTATGLAQAYLDDAVETDGHGEFSIQSVAFGAFRVFAQRDGFAPAISDPFSLTAHHSGPKLRLVLGTGGRIVGHVEYPGGKIAKQASIRVVAKKQVSGLRPAWEAIADERGEFFIDGVRAGTVVVTAELKESSSPPTELQIAMGSTTKDLRIVLEHNQTVSGQTVDEAGQPVPGARVSAIEASRSLELDSLTAAPPHAANADEDGFFAISGLPSGTLHLFASRDGSQDLEQILYGKTPVIVEAGTENVRLVVPSYGGVRGEIRYADDSGSPAVFELGSGNGALTKFSSRDGSFELTRVHSGRAALRVSGPDFAGRVIRGVEVKPGKVSDIGVIPVSRGRNVSGRVLDAKGDPVPLAEVYAGKRLIASGSGFTTTNWGLAGTGDESRMIKTDSAGQFEFRGFGTRGLAIAAQHPDRGRSSVSRVPAGKESHRVDLILGQGTDLTVYVRRDGEPVPGVSVNISPIPSSNHSNFVSKTNQEGVATFNNMRSSNYVVSAMFGMSPIVGIAQIGKKFRFDSSGDTAVDLELPSKSFSTEVLVYDAHSQKPFEMVEVHTFSGKVTAENARSLRRLADEFSGGFYAFNIGLGGMGAKVSHLAARASYTSCAVPFPSNIAKQPAAVVKKYATAKGGSLAAFCKTYHTKEQVGKVSISAKRPPEADFQRSQDVSRKR